MPRDGERTRPGSDLGVGHGQPWSADVIVVGSGFGGAVASARLAQAGYRVLTVERGRRWPPGSFPRRPELGAGWLWQSGQGLYDLRWLDRMATVQAAGWGGGSLVYANVFARPSPQLPDGRWPDRLRRRVLEPYYDLAAHMLEVQPVTDDPGTGRLPDRTRLVARLLESTDVSQAMFRPNLAVTFGDPGTARPNIHGVERRGCAFVGECVIGCNHGAKNTLDHTYLAVAEAAGARSITDAQVDRLTPVPGGYRITVSTPSDPAAAPRSFLAPRVFLAAGAVATTELLLRARDVDRTLPQLSRRLGEGFSGNGDYLDLADIRGGREDLTTGPTITTSTVLDVPEGSGSAWFQVQDGAIPPALSRLIDSVIPAPGARRAWRRLQRRRDRNEFALLSMGRDSGDGVLQLDRQGEAVLRWQNRWQARLYRAQGRVGPLIARILGASVRAPITWTLLRKTVTVHPLGGVPTGPDVDTAVVDDLGEVHGAPGLFVIDGSVIPAATGVNPSATILAAAEQATEQIIRRHGRPDWRAPEWDEVRPTPIPEDDAFAFAAHRRAATAGDGIRFVEELQSGRPQQPLRLTLAGHVPSMDRFLTDDTHTIELEGTIEAPGLATTAHTSGTMQMFPAGSAAAMQYDLEFTDDAGRPRTVHASKIIHGVSPPALLRGLTTLNSQLTPADTDHRSTAVLTMRPLHIARLLNSLAGEGFTGPRRARAYLRFVAFFASSALRTARTATPKPQRDSPRRAPQQ